MVPPLIAIEEHFDSQIFKVDDELHANLPAHLRERLRDIGQGRLRELDKGGTRLQVVSHIGVDTPVDCCIRANDMLAAVCAESNGRLAGFATLPMQDPQAAAAELERTVREHQFLGALINNATEDGSMYDDKRFWQVFEKAVHLDVPVYIHPSYPAQNLSGHYAGDFTPMAKVMMSSAGWGWHAECGLHILRLFASGLFDRFPTLKIVIGHMGEMIPYQLDRICHSARHWGEFERDLRTVWRDNIWVTTSGMFTLPPFECLLKMSRKDHVMFSVDYPFSTTETGLQFVEEIERSGLLTNEELLAFCHGNAQRLLKVNLDA